MNINKFFKFSLFLL